MVEKMKALAKNEIWDLITLFLRKKLVGCKWLFSVNHKTNGSIERYKARLVVVDYQETGMTSVKPVLRG